MAVAVLETRDLAVGRGGRVVLAGVSLTVGGGELFALLGLNGSGKTTLLRALAGIDRPLAGEIRWDGGPLRAGAGRVGQVGVLFQDEPPAPFSVRTVVTLGLGLDGPPGPADRARVEGAIDRLGLGRLADRPCRRLSGGEWQRAALARALVAGPRLLLLDEPASHLDPARRASSSALLASLGVAVVLATHDLDAAAACDRVLLLGGGGVAAQGPPSLVLTPERLLESLRVRVRRLDDPDGGAPFLRLESAA
jgi:iron complex transport system ATP-binding protein